MDIKAIFAGMCACFLFLTIVPESTAQAELPTWNVGDTWAMGARDEDITSIFTVIMENLKQIYSDLTYEASGKLSYFIIYKVDAVEAQQYRVAVDGGIEMTADMSYSISYQGQQSSVSTNMTMVAKINGTIYYTKNELAVARQDLALDLDMDFSISGSGAMDTNVSGSADMTGNMSATYNPSLDIFDFPITIGENWTAESDVTVTGSITGKVSAMGMEQSTSQSLDNTFHLSLSASCPSTQDVTLPDGSIATCYKLVVSGTGYASPLPLTGTLYYSPDQRFIVATGLTFGDVMGTASFGSTETLPSYTQSITEAEGEQVLFTMSPVTEQEARDAIAGMGAEGISIVIIGALAAIIIAAIAAVLVVVRRRRAKPVVNKGLAKRERY